MARKHQREKSPAFQWYPKDALTDASLTVMHLSAEGMYRRLLDNAWIENGLPDDLDKIFTISKCVTRAQFDKLWKTVNFKFPIAKDGRRRNPRQERTRREQRKHSKKNKLAAEKRWENERSKQHAREFSTDANASSAQCSASALALASKNLVQSQSHRRAERVGLGVDSDRKGKTVALLAAMCHGDLIQPMVALNGNVPERGVLISALMGHAKTHATVTFTEQQATAAVDKALARWGQRRSA